VEASALAVVFLGVLNVGSPTYFDEKHRLPMIAALLVVRFWSVVGQQMLLGGRSFDSGLILDCCWYAYNITVPVYMFWTESVFWGINVVLTTHFPCFVAKAAAAAVCVWFWIHYFRIDNWIWWLWTIASD